jgi:signal peptidase
MANTVLIAVCALAAAATVGNLAGWWRFDSVLSGSMRPGMQPGDVEILRPEPVSALRVGQIVAFHPPKDQFTVTHRIIALRHHDGTWITTKGDANNVSDPWGSIRVLRPTAWVVSGVVPHVGYLSVWVRTPLPHLLMVTTIVLFVCFIALEAIWRPKSPIHRGGRGER